MADGGGWVLLRRMTEVYNGLLYLLPAAVRVRYREQLCASFRDAGRTALSRGGRRALALVGARMYANVDARANRASDGSLRRCSSTAKAQTSNALPKGDGNHG